MAQNDFLSDYLTYAATDSEVPVVLHRWAAISAIGAMLGRRYYFQHGHFNINSNLYTMFIGVPATRKSTAIKLVKNLIKGAGYSTIAADKSSKEKFLLDLSGAGDDTPGLESVDDILDKNIFGDSESEDAEVFIMADELNDFIGNGNIEFISLLGSLWDYSGNYSSRIKSGKSVSICNPTVSILAGNTPTGFALAFPNEIIGQGFFSRLILIFAEPTGKKIPFPESPSLEQTAEITKGFRRIRETVNGLATAESSAKKLLEKIYVGYVGIDDTRFVSYSSRRFNQLLKLCLIISASRLSTTITEKDVIYANTILTQAEKFMPKALGEFGKARNSDVSQAILSLIENAGGIITLKEIWKHVSKDLDRMAQLGELLQNLQMAEKIQSVNVTLDNGDHRTGFLPNRKIREIAVEGTVDYSLLTPEERGI